MMTKMEIPEYVKKVIGELQARDFEAYIIGGCVRDLLLSKKPSDWDVATNALPEQIQEVFPDSFYKNKFGTVTIKNQNPKLKIQTPHSQEVEITTYRTESKYTDKRHPDEVKFAKTLEEDLKRRDFTVNAMAIKIKSQKSNPKNQLEVIDLYGGQQDLSDKIIRAVGEPQKRFGEDALRLMRAVRFACQLGFQIEPKTLTAIKENNQWLKAIAKERIRDELVKIIMSSSPDQGILLLKDTGLLTHIVSELEVGIGMAQNRHHIYTIFEHSVLSLKFAAQYKFSLAVRLAALFHDIAKPQTKRGEGQNATFYAHDVLGAKFASRILERLRFSRKIIERVARLVRYHMFFYDVETVTEAGVRRLLVRIGPENFQDLLNLRITDRLGSGCPKDKPYKLRHLEYLVEKVSQDPISPKMIKVDGNDVMKILGINPGPRVGLIINALLSEILDDPKKNQRDYLEGRIKELDKLSDTKLKSAVKKIDEKKEEVDLEIKQKHWVK